jgi:hypothetical protein
MVLLKNENEGIVECIYDSTNVLASKFIIKERKLAVIFISGKQYVYSDVKYEDYLKFERDQSQGKILNSVIKKYVTEKSDKIVDVNVIMEQIVLIKKNKENE